MLIVEEEEEGSIFTIGAFNVREVEAEEEVEVTIIDSRLNTPEERKNKGRESSVIVNVMDVKETEIDGMEMTNTPEDELSELDDTDLLTKPSVGPVTTVD